MVRSSPALFVHRSEVCPPRCVWPWLLSAVSQQCVTFSVIYDSSLPKITPGTLSASVLVWPYSAIPAWLEVLSTQLLNKEEKHIRMDSFFQLIKRSYSPVKTIFDLPGWPWTALKQIILHPPYCLFDDDLHPFNVKLENLKDWHLGPKVISW